jgi:hypothetical protein
MQKNFLIMGLKTLEKPPEIEESREEQWLQANALKIERIRQRV